MARLLLLGLLAGLDNLLIAAAMSVAPVSRPRRLLLLAAFATCELASPLTGVLVAYVLRTRLHVSFEGIGPFVVVACGSAIVVLALREREQAQALLTSKWTLVTVPLSLSLDNLLIGFSAIPLGYAPLIAALVIGATSATLCAIGVLSGARISRWIPARVELVSGCALILLAASMWIRS